MMLQLDQIETYLDQFHILQGVSLSVQAGSITVLFGRNGAGKTTTLRSIMGLAPIRYGQIRYLGEEIGHLPTYSIARKGIGYVPENQGIFHDFTIEETFRLAMQKNDDEQKEKLAWMLDLFPDLRHYWKKKSGHLSGGQKQMLAIARAYVNSNGLLLIDEPSKGLAPIMVEKLMFHIESMKQKTTVLLVEQNFMMASMIGEQYYLMDEGKIVRGGAMQELKDDADTRQKYLGIA